MEEESHHEIEVAEELVPLEIPLDHEEETTLVSETTTQTTEMEFADGALDENEPETEPTRITPPAESKPAKKLSALDAALLVLDQAPEPLNAQQLIAAMSEQGLWTSPGGKTPHLTLSSAIQREINTKGDASRFRKTEPGKFARNS